MSTTSMPSVRDERATARPQGALARLAPPGGAGLLLAPLLMLGATATSPPQADDSPAAYIESLAADPALTALSAGLFHYGWLFIAFGALAALTLVRGRRGRALTTVGALMTAVGAFQIGGLLLSDWYLAALGAELPVTDAVRVFEAVGTDVWMLTWLQSGRLLPLLGMPVLFAGLARAGVLPWWLVPGSLGAMIVPFVVPGPLGLALGAVCWAPMVLTGYRLVRRARADVRDAEARG
ncbi:hypothetical protein [Aquipuribacter nitratireducens]|uniref:DUF4386 family protein n=1 Tax=Aquipuribacter nitratireducens TaxID=650104 RepID=A0ABW0GIM4_9MICO